MNQITVKELYEICKNAIKDGDGNKYIVVSDDNEGNGFHGLFYGLSPLDDDYIDLIYDSNHNSKSDTIILG
jgi:hypothetical protein